MSNVILAVLVTLVLVLLVALALKLRPMPKATSPVAVVAGVVIAALTRSAFVGSTKLVWFAIAAVTLVAMLQIVCRLVVRLVEARARVELASKRATPTDTQESRQLGGGRSSGGARRSRWLSSPPPSAGPRPRRGRRRARCRGGRG